MFVLKNIAVCFLDLFWCPCLINFSHQTEEGFFDVMSCFGRGFIKTDSFHFGKRLSFLKWNFSSVVQVTFVSNHGDGDHLVVAFDSFYLIKKSADLFEWNSACDWIDHNKSFRVSDPLVSQRSKLFLSCCIQNFDSTYFSINWDLSWIAVFNCWVVCFDKVCWKEKEK